MRKESILPLIYLILIWRTPRDYREPEFIATPVPDSIVQIKDYKARVKALKDFESRIQSQYRDDELMRHGLYREQDVPAAKKEMLHKIGK